MIAWGVLKHQILSGVLKDAAGTKFSAEALLYYARSACAELSFHTAETKVHTWICDGKQSEFVLPDDMIDTVEDTALVGYFQTDKTEYLPNLRLKQGSLWPTPTSNPMMSGATLAQSTSNRDFPRNNSTYKTLGYWEYPSGVLTLSFIPADGERILLRYFKVWTPPENDDSIMYFPVWMEKPFAYILAAYAMDPAIISATNIRQFNDRTQSGTPEMNPPMKQAEYFIAQARRLLQMHRSQNREQFYAHDMVTD